MSLQAAIEHYHTLLLADGLAEDSHAHLDSQLRRRGLYFGDRPLCSVLRPRFLTPGQYSFLQGRSRLILTAFEKVYNAAMSDDGFLERFRLEDWERELLHEDPGFRDPSPVSRLDAFFVSERGGLKFTEYNAETPAAAAYNDVLAHAFLGLPVMREFLRRYEVRPQPSRQNVMHALLNAWHQWSGLRTLPRVAILDWHDVPTYSEFVITAEYLRSQGLECTIADPDDAEFRNGRLYIGDGPVDLIYKRVLVNELVERGGLNHAVIRAVRERAVCMVNPFRCKILHKKASLAALSDERSRGLFTAGEVEAIETHIPWTRVVEERRTVFHGREVDLVPFIGDNRESLVLKPNDDYGGRGIALGWETDAPAWAVLIRHAMTEPYVVQERVEIPLEAYPAFVDGRIEFEERIMDTAPFVYYGAYMDGCLTRLSTASLVNVTAGGGSALATFVVENR